MVHLDAGQAFVRWSSEVTRFKGQFDLKPYEWPGYQGNQRRLDHAFVGAVSHQSSGTG